MTFKGLIKKSKPHFDSLFIDRYFGRSLRSWLRFVFSLSAVGAFSLSFGTFSFIMSKADSVFFIFAFLLLCLVFLEIFYNSMRHQGIGSRVAESALDPSNRIDFALSELLYGTDDIDLSRAFFDTSIGREVMRRLAISIKDLEEFIQGDRTPIIGSSLRFDNDDVSFVQYMLAVYDSDHALQQFLSDHFASRNDVAGASLWVQEEVEMKLRKERIWSRENLGTFPSIGSSWRFGTTFEMPDYCKYFHSNHFWTENDYQNREVLQLESAFEGLRSNVVIVAEQKNADEIVGKVSQKIRLGTSLPSLEHKSIIYYDWMKMLAELSEPSDIAKSIRATFDKAKAEQNVIILFHSLPEFIIRTKSKNINFLDIIKPHLLSNDLQIITTALPVDAKLFMAAPELESLFEKIYPSGGIMALLPEARRVLAPIEERYKITFSYGAIIAILNHSSRFDDFKKIVPVESMEKMAIVAKAKNLEFVSEPEVNDFFSKLSP